MALMTARRVWIWLHRWTGLTLGLLLTAAALLGALMTVLRPLDEAMHPELFRAPVAAATASGAAPVYTLGGTIQRDGDTIRVITRMTSERSGEAVWTRTSNYDGNEVARVPRHIAVDAVKKVLPDRWKRPFELTAGLITVALSLFLTILGAIYCRNNWLDWIASEHRSSVFDVLPIPYWIATLPIPIGFGLTSARFLASAIYGTKEVDVLTSLGAADLEAKP